MKIFQQITILIIVLAFFGCATTTQNLPKPIPNVLEKGKVRIKLNRINEYVGSGNTFTIYDNGKLVGKLGQNKPLEWDRPTGEVSLSRDWNYLWRVNTANNSISFTAQEGYVYELYIGNFDGFTTNSSSDKSREYLAKLLVYQLSELSSPSLPPTSFGGGKNKGCQVYGKIKFVEYGEDYKVNFVSIGEDIKIKYVSILADSPGEWQVVDYGEDYKVKIVDFDEDFKVREVITGEGCK